MDCCEEKKKLDLILKKSFKKNSTYALDISSLSNTYLLYSDGYGEGGGKLLTGEARFCCRGVPLGRPGLA